MANKQRAKPKNAEVFDEIMVKRVMERKVRSARLTTKAAALATMMLKHGFGAIPVLDGRKQVAGIVSEHDLLVAIDDGHQLNELTAGDVMTGNPYSVRPETTLGTLAHVLRASDLVRVPVVDDKDRLIGIVARRDVLRSYLASRPRPRK